MFPKRPLSSTAANPCERANVKICDKSHLGQPSVEKASGISDGARFRGNATAAAANERSIRNSRRVDCMFHLHPWNRTGLYCCLKAGGGLSLGSRLLRR